MSLNYSFIETMNLLIEALNYGIMKCIIISTLILVYLYYKNESKLIKYISIGINLLLIFVISFYYVSDILKFNFIGLVNNMYFYFFNCILYLILNSFVNLKYKIINCIIYWVSLINILFSLFITHYLHNIDIYVLGNIYPMIKFGNIIYIIYYILLIIHFLKIKKRI